MAKRTLRPSQLIEDLTIYPRSSIDDNTVARYKDALEAGDTLPPPIVDEKSLRIVDGFHRIRAWKKAFGDDKMPVEVRTYATEEELIGAAVQLNAAHGKPYASQDFIRVHRLLHEHGYTLADSAKVLRITPQRLTTLVETRTATVADIKVTTKRSKRSGSDLPITLKPALRHLAGAQLTPDQARVNAYLSGNDQTYLTRQVTMLVETGLVDRDNQTLLHDLATLRDRLNAADLPALITA